MAAVAEPAKVYVVKSVKPVARLTPCAALGLAADSRLAANSAATATDFLILIIC